MLVVKDKKNITHKNPTKKVAYTIGPPKAKRTPKSKENSKLNA